MHRFFRSPNKAPAYGFWVVLDTGTQRCRVPEKGGADHFGDLVNLVVSQAGNVGFSIPGSSHDFVANLICRRDPGFCTRSAARGTADQKIPGNVSAIKKTKSSGCKRCGGKRIR